MIPQTPSKLHAEFAREVHGLVVTMHDIIRTSRNKCLKTEAEIQVWANEWVEAAGDFVEKLMELTDKMYYAEYFKEVDWKENDPLMKLLIGLVNSLNQITDKVYSIQNQFLLRDIYAQKAILEKQLQQEQVDAAKRASLETEKKLAQQVEDLHKKELEEKELDEQIRQRARARALNDHTLWLKEKKAKEALDEELGYCDYNDKSIISEAPDDETILKEYAPERKKGRRSRSLGRRIISTVKKTVKRSISTMNHIIDHD